MMDTSRFFGADGVFQCACEAYSSGIYPERIKEHAETLGNSRIAYALGYTFAVEILNRQLAITQDELWEIAIAKIRLGEPKEFVKGFYAGNPKGGKPF